MILNKLSRRSYGIIGVVSTLIVIVISCSESFLDVTNTNTLPGNTIPSRMLDVELLVADVYGRLRYGYLDAYPQARIGYSASHNADQAYSDNNFDAGAQVNFNPNSSDVAEMWSKHYENINKANATLDAIAKIKTNGTVLTDDDKTNLLYREGEVRFIRAFNYYYLINFFGETFITSPEDRGKKGVPLIKKVAVELPETKVPRASIGEVWDFIKSDLRAAQVLLDKKTWSGADQARVSIWAVKAFLGKCLVFTQQWDSARVVLKDVIDNSGKTLVPYDVYRDIFVNKNKFSDESIFELNYNDKQINGGWQNTTDAITYLPIIISPSFITVADDGTESTDCNGFCNLMIHDKSLARFGWTDTTKQTYSRPEYISMSNDIRNNKSVDPRLWVSVQQPRLDTIYIDGKPKPISKNKGEGIQDVIKERYGWSFRKFTLTNRGIWSGATSQIAMNLPWLRMADVYLLYAEAMAKPGGDEVIALEFINKVRRRGYGLPINVANASIDYKSLNDATAASSDDHLHNNPLAYERWVELFGEHGSWWFDVCRWKMGQQETQYYQRVATGELRWNDNRSYALPIPQTEINGNSIVQNPGY
jgi:hypothetical protein